MNKVPTASTAGQNLSYITDGIFGDYGYAETGVPAWIKIDLGQSYNIDRIKLWHLTGWTFHDVVVQVSNDANFGAGSVTTVFNNDTDTGLTNGTAYYYVVTATNATGESANSNQASATPAAGTSTNVALNKSVTSSDANASSLPLVTNGIVNDYAGIAPGPQWVQIDLGASYTLNQIKLWHYAQASPQRTTYDVVVQISNAADFSTKTTLFNNDASNHCGQGAGTDAVYQESTTGKSIPVANLVARYVRFWSNGDSSGYGNFYQEAEVYGQ